MRYLVTLILSLFTLLASPYATTPIQIEIYTIPGCLGCGMAKSMFDERGIPYTEINLQGRRDLYKQMKERVFASMPSDQRGSLEDSMTVPRIFINGKYIGGYGDLDASKLDKISTQISSKSKNDAPNSAKQTNKNIES